MISVYVNDDLIPNKSKGLDLEKLHFRFSSHYWPDSFIEKGTEVCTIYLPGSTPISKSEEIATIYAPISGFICKGRAYIETLGLYKKDTLLFTITTFNEVLDSLDATYQIYTDSFSQVKRIRWTSLFNTPYRIPNFFRYAAFVSVSFNYDGNAHLLMRVWRNKFKPKTKDTVSFLFADSEVKTYFIKNKPLKEDDDYIVDIELSQTDLNKFIEAPIDTIRFESKAALPFAFSLYTRNSLELGQIIFQRFAKRFSEALDEIGIKWETKETKEETPSSNDPCFVYLMVDTTNGFHKIGISNHPEYREGTLQSEKPTIELLCAKQFPSRAIAKAIESALHKTYEEKHIRGEWFQLEAKDIIDLMAALK